MSEQEQVIESEGVVEREFTVDETKAMQHGWVPKDQWTGDPEEWIPAKVFNMRGDFFSRIAKDKKEISELRQTVDHLVDHSRKAYEAGYKQGLAELRAQRREALEAGDVERVEQIEDKIDEFKEEHAAKQQEFEQKTTKKTTQDNPVFDAWHVENEWYMADPTLTTYANEVATEYATKAQTSGVQVDYPKLLQEISRKVKQKFPERFGRTKGAEKSTSAVDGGSNSADDKSTVKRSNKFSEADLSEQDRKIMETVLKTTKLTKEEYLEQVGAYAKRKGG